MPRSHPPSLITIVRRTLLDECGPLRQRSVLAAVSGGSDSQAMLEVLARLAPELGFRLRAHGVDHGLRAEAAGELDLAEALAARLGVPFTRSRLKLQRGTNLQARAREARYTALREVAAADRAMIATAHHALDRAETVLLRLLRGAGPRGLAVLPARAQDVIRPLLRATKPDVLAHLSRHRIEFARDPSNGDAAFLRVRVRHELIPMLENLSPQIVRHLNALADALEGARLPELGLGEVPELNRAQIREAQRAARLGRAVTIRLAGARDVVVGKAAAGAGAATATRQPVVAGQRAARKNAATTAAKKPPLSPKHQRKV